MFFFPSKDLWTLDYGSLKDSQFYNLDDGLIMRGSQRWGTQEEENICGEGGNGNDFG